MSVSGARRFGYFSARATRWSGWAVYSTPSGELVEVTCVSEHEGIARVLETYKWPDLVSVGEVLEFVQSYEKPALWVDTPGGVSVYKWPERR